MESPATIANIGPGFDILSFALEEPRDIVTVVVSEGRGRISVVSLDPRVPSGRDNVAYTVAESFLEEFEIRGVDLEILVDKKVPPARGLGSSAATSAATVKALAVALDVDADEKKLLSLAVRGEEHASGSRHYDNVAASLLGGFVISDPSGGEFIKIEPPVEVPVGVVIPNIEVPERKTGYSRSLLPDSITLKEHVAQSFNIAKLVYSIASGDTAKLGEASSSDVIVEPRRSSLIPYYYDLKKLALRHGALGFNISGAGPSVFFIARSVDDAARIASILISYLRERGVSAEYIATVASRRGAEVVKIEED